MRINPEEARWRNNLVLRQEWRKRLVSNGYTESEVQKLFYRYRIRYTPSDAEGPYRLVESTYGPQLGWRTVVHSTDVEAIFAQAMAIAALEAVGGGV